MGDFKIWVIFTQLDAWFYTFHVARKAQPCGSDSVFFAIANLASFKVAHGSRGLNAITNYHGKKKNQ